MIEGYRVCHRFGQGPFHVAFLIKWCPRQRQEVHHANDDFFLAQILEDTHRTVLPLLAFVMGRAHEGIVCSETHAAYVTKRWRATCVSCCRRSLKKAS